MSLKDKTVVITGAASGIGAACKEEFLRAGSRVALLDIRFPKTRPDKKDVLYIYCDVSSEDQVISALKQVNDTFDRIDLLINNAGIQRYGTVTETTSELWDEVMNVNLKSLFLCSKYTIPYMQRSGGGVIVNIASVQAFLSQKKVAAYTTAKSAILGFTRSIAVDYAPSIRCVAVCPGSIDTPMLRQSISQSPNPDETMQDCIDMHLAGRIGTPEEVAALVVFLSDEKAGFITGQSFRIDGGLGISIPG